MLSFQTPQGVKDELFNEYEVKQGIVKVINTNFKSFGYREVFTPTIEYYDVFSSIKSTVLKDEMFKLIDKSGEILVLRPDVTIPIARIVANNYKNFKKEFKVFYTTQVFRTNNEKRREFTQTGIEYFGNKNPEADGEVIAIAIKSLLSNDLNFNIEIGHADYYKGLLEETSLDENIKSRLKELIENKNFVEIEKLVSELSLDSKIKSIITQIPNLYGDCGEVLEKAREFCLNEKMSKALNELKEVCEILKDYGYAEYISIDLGLINHLDYYTGTMFKGYMSNYGETILSGGRYDKLTESYGQYIPATGFGINIDELISGILKQNNIKVKNEYIDYKVIYELEDRKEALNLANILRDKGFIIEVEKQTSIKENNLENLKDINKLVKIELNDLEVTDVKKKSKEKLTLSEFMKSI